MRVWLDAIAAFALGLLLEAAPKGARPGAVLALLTRRRVPR